MYFRSIKNKSARITIKILISFLLFLIVAFPFLFTTTHTANFKEEAYYKTMMSRLKNATPMLSKSQSFKVGWAKESITPKVPIPIAGYGWRNNYEAINDSLWVRSFVMDNGHSKVAIITLDLLIFPPAITKKLEQLIADRLNIHNLYLSSTHTHNGAGGWAEGLGGRFLAGNYDSAYVNFVLSSIIKSVTKASQSTEEAEIGFAKYDAPYLIRNRLVKGDEVDSWIRIIKIRKKSGATALVTSFPAHPTSISSKEDKLSGDYPGALVSKLEKTKSIDFAAFLSGPVGSMALREHGYRNFELVDFVSERLKNKILDGVDSIIMKRPEELSYLKVKIALPEPQLTIFPFFRLRPWVFNVVLGEYPSFIYSLRIDDTVLVATPCDFSGTLSDSFNPLLEQKKYNLLITSFNGSYIGYITPKKYNDLNKSETKEMNWYGPNSGSYFIDIINKIIQKI